MLAQFSAVSDHLSFLPQLVLSVIFRIRILGFILPNAAEEGFFTFIQSQHTLAKAIPTD